VLAILFLQAITGAHTPACLFSAYNPVETVTPPWLGIVRWTGLDTF
jgi:hypothetical protein